MRDLLVANVSDVLKFAFLRALARDDSSPGVAWYYVPGENGRLGGEDLGWRNERGWKQLDPILYEALTSLPERSVEALECAAFWPGGTLFYREPMPRPRDRDTWGVQMRAVLDGADIVYLDPDIGLGKEDAKHATLTELRLLRRPGRTIVFITFPGKNMPYDARVQQLHEQISSVANAETVITLRTSVSVPVAEGSPYYVPRARWFTVVDPDDTLIDRTGAFADTLAAVPRVSLKLDGVT